MNLQQQRDKEQKVLHGYGWVNQGAGVARMPIDEAKKLILERGLPVREGEDVSPTLGTRLPARGESSGGRDHHRARAGSAAGSGSPQAPDGSPRVISPERRHTASSPPPSRTGRGGALTPMIAPRTAFAAAFAMPP